MTKSKQISPSKLALGMIGAAMVPAAATAEETGAGITLSFDAGIGTGDASNRIFQNKLGTDDFNEFSTDTAFVGSVGASGAINNTWDWKLSVSRTEYTNNVLSTDDVFDSSYASMKAEKSSAAYNATVGRSFETAGASSRLGLGLAYGSSTETADKGVFYDGSEADDGYFAETGYETTFQGIGPRLTFDVESAPVSKNGRLSLIGGADVNVLYGKYTESGGINAYADDGAGDFLLVSGSERTSGSMVTAGLYLGAKYQVSDVSAVRFGLRHDVSKADIDSNVISDRYDDSLTSAFIGLDVKF
jgi:hypothetical protein